MSMAAIKIILLLLVAASTQLGSRAAEAQNLNGLVDTLVDGVKTFMKISHKGTITIPDMVKSFHKKIGFINFSGGINATGGIFKDIANFKRTGDATLTLDKEKQNIRLFLGLDDMDISFNSARIWLGKISATQSVQVKVKKNSVDVEIAVINHGFKCNATLENIKINELKDLDISIKGSGLLSTILENMAGWIMDHFNKNIRYLAEKELYKQVSQELQKHDVCKYLL